MTVYTKKAKQNANSFDKFSYFKNKNKNRKLDYRLFLFPLGKYVNFQIEI